MLGPAVARQAVLVGLDRAAALGAKRDLVEPGDLALTLYTRGVFAPLLLSDDAEALPPKLEEYLLSVQPGYEDNPGEAVYNRAWVLGDDTAISVPQQAQIDQLTELVPVQANAP